MVVDRCIVDKMVMEGKKCLHVQKRKAGNEIERKKNEVAMMQRGNVTLGCDQS